MAAIGETGAVAATDSLETTITLTGEAGAASGKKAGDFSY